MHVRFTSYGIPRTISVDPIEDAVDDEFVVQVRVTGVLLPD